MLVNYAMRFTNLNNNIAEIKNLLNYTINLLLMKFKNLLLFLSAPILLLSLQCKKDKSPEEQLPPETQTGAGTFGCLVNGNIFKPKGDPFGGPILSASYQYLNTSSSSGYFFSVSARNTTTAATKGISINTDSLPIQQGQTIVLKKFGKKGAASGQFSIFDNNTLSFNEYLTTALVTGELKIAKLDSINRIVSGTFWFDAVNSTGEKVQVRNGRFDMKYSL